MTKENFKTVVLGASPNSGRYSYLATNLLQKNGIETIPVGLRDGEINGLKIHSDRPPVENVHTITLYVGPQNQPEYYDYILSLNPKRIIFNPGTENEELMKLTAAQGIHNEVACTLVLLNLGIYKET
jgi:predicted CoA-binding protein